ERFDGHGDLFSEIERGPHQRKEKKDSEKHQNEEELALEGAEMLFLLVVGGGLELDFGKAVSEVARHVARNEKCFAFSGGGACGDEELISRGPEFGAALQFLLENRETLLASARSEQFERPIRFLAPGSICFGAGDWRDGRRVVRLTKRGRSIFL